MGKETSRIKTLGRFQREHLDLNAPVPLVVVGVARVGGGRQGIVPAVANDFEFVGVELIFVHDCLADSVGTVVGKLADQVGWDDAFAAGVGIALDDDVGVAEPAGQLANFLQRLGNGPVIFRVEHGFVWLERNHYGFGQNLAGAGL